MVRCGLENTDALDRALKDKKLGLLTSVSGVDHRLQSGIELLHERYHLTALFGPEHGVRGSCGAGETVGCSTDPLTGLPVYSLYREDSKHLTPEMLEGIDAVVYDIQDLGVRFYTFISSLLYTLQDCAAAGKELIVLDRPDPLDGLSVEGGLMQPEFESFVGAYRLPIRYGLTPGELAQMVNRQQKIGCKLTVVPVLGWQRRMLYPETELLFMMPSLGIPRFETALIYAGMCLIEGTNVSEGRGTSCPFELIGAPWIDAHALSRFMNEQKLPGVIFTPAWFTPTASKHAGVPCQGIHLHLTDPHAFVPVRTGIELLHALRTLYPDSFAFLPPVRPGSRPFISLLAGCDVFSYEQWDKDQLLARFEAESRRFALEKKSYHLYD